MATPNPKQRATRPLDVFPDHVAEVMPSPGVAPSSSTPPARSATPRTAPSAPPRSTSPCPACTSSSPRPRSTYVERRGCVVRSYAGGNKRALRGVVGNQWRSFGGELLERFPGAARVEAEHDAWAHKHLVADWAAIGVEIDKHSRRRGDPRP